MIFSLGVFYLPEKYLFDAILFEPLEEADMKIYVGNMNFDTSESDLRTAFEAHGTVDSVNVITDRDTGRAKGFAFIEMSNDTEGQAAIDALNEKDLQGRALKVNVAKPRTDNRGGGGGGRGGFGRGGY